MARDECRTDTRRTSNSGDRFDKKNEITSFAMSDTLKIWKSIRITSDNDSGASSSTQRAASEGVDRRAHRHCRGANMRGSKADRKSTRLNSSH